MRAFDPNYASGSRLRPLVACLAIALSPAFAADAGAFIPSELWRDASSFDFHQPSTTLLVTNCNDAGPDSLREAVTSATDGATVQFDLAQMQCSTITLTTGQIDVLVDNLTIQGPGADLLTIDGGYSSGYINRILNHPSPTALGTLRISGLTLRDAIYAPPPNQPAKGGCLYSGGSIVLSESIVTNCQSVSIASYAAGGGVNARASFKMVNSTVSQCIAFGGGGAGYGGGIHAGVIVGSTFSAKYSTIEDNTAIGTSGTSKGGGIRTRASDVEIQRSTISGNHSEWGGGLVSTDATILSDSTISGNVGTIVGGAEVLGAFTMFSSTIARNTATVYGRIAGVHATSLEANSSIFAFNMTDDGTSVIEADIEVSNNTVTGANNLIMATDAMTPINTLSSCPRLAPLLNNGGTTRTHALLPGSPAIEGGNNAANLETDQRGAGFARIVGTFADIGAYEWSEGSGEVISKSDFENCD